MSAEQDHVRALASRIAQRVSQTESAGAQSESASAENAGDELASVRKSLEEMKRKLASIEEHLSQERNAAYSADVNEKVESESRSQEGSAVRPPTSVRSPWLSGVYVPAAHPSQEKFDVEEAAVGQLIVEDLPRQSFFIIIKQTSSQFSSPDAQKVEELIEQRGHCLARARTRGFTQEFH